MRTQIPAECYEPSWQTGPRLSEAPKGHIRAWMLLAPPPEMYSREVAKVEAPLLDSQVDGKPTTRSSERFSLTQRPLGCQRSLGVPIEESSIARKADQKVLGGD